MRALLLVIIGLPSLASAQVLTPTVLTTLNADLNETSGLIVANGEVWTHVDGGGSNAIHRIDPSTGSVMRSVVITNATNLDWEDMTVADGWLYLADAGNNSGTRTDLRILRVALEEVLDTGTSSVLADTIRFAYDLQSDFTPALNANDWDCEALIALNDTIYLFSKNWVSGTCYRYALPAIPGDQVAQRIDTLETLGMVTGASRDATTGQIALVGYTNGTFQPFVWHLSDYPGSSVFQGTAIRHGLAAVLTQFEGIAWSGAGTVLLTNEQNILSPARLWQLSIDPGTSVVDDNAKAPRAWPIPNDGGFLVEVDRATSCDVRDAQGRLLLTQRLDKGVNTVRLEGQPAGTYALYIGSSAVIRVVKQ